MSPQIAARRFVAGVLRSTLHDLLDLSERDAAAYGEVEAAVRQRYKTVDVDVEALEKDVRKAASEKDRAPVSSALSKLIEALADELNTREQTAYLIGIEIGRTLCLPPTRKPGGR
jgi:hypothetical protein